MIADLLVGIDTATEFEVVSQLAEPLQVQTVGGLMGMAEPDRHRILGWTHRATQACLGEHRGTIAAQQMLVGMLSPPSCGLRTRTHCPPQRR